MANVWYLVVGGGGGGAGVAANVSGGGGAGGFRDSGTYTHAVTVQAYAVTVGDGGPGGIGNAKGTNGDDSVFDTITSLGGGGGGNQQGAGLAGGSGGGGGNGNTGAGAGGLGTAGQGNDGGTAQANVGAGGGGAGAVGNPGTANVVGGAGGNGSASTISGVSVTYAGGGGGGGPTQGLGGTGGGGNGETLNLNNGTAGTANTGGGGGGRHNVGAGIVGYQGGSGRVEIRYVTGSLTATGGTITTVGGDTLHTFTGNGTFDVTDIPVAPTAEFMGTPTSGASPLAVQFTDLSTGSPTSWLWDFGDGQTSTSQNPLHIYEKSGSYTVSLTATNAQGSDQETKSGYIAVAVSGGGDSTRLRKRGRKPKYFWQQAIEDEKKDEIAEAAFDAVADAYLIEGNREFVDQVNYIKNVESRLRAAKFLEIAEQLETALKDLKYKAEMRVLMAAAQEEAELRELMEII